MIVDERYTTYLNSLYPELSPVLKDIQREALESYVPIIRPETVNLLQLLIKMNQPKTILEVGAVGVSTEVTPFPYHSVADEAVVSLVGVAEDDGLAKFTAHLAVGTDGSAAIDLGIHLGNGVLAEGDGAAEAAPFHHFGTAPDVDGAAGGVEHRGFNHRSLLDKDAGRVANDGVGRTEGLRGAAGGEVGKVAFDLLPVQQEKVVRAADEIVRTCVFNHLQRKCAVSILEITVEEVAQVEGVAGAESEERVLVIECVAWLEGTDGIQQLRVGQQGARDEQVVAGGAKRELLLKVAFRKSGSGRTQHALPFLADGSDAHAQVGGGACVRKREQVWAAPVVEQYQIHTGWFYDKKNAAFC